MLGSRERHHWRRGRQGVDQGAGRLFTWGTDATKNNDMAEVVAERKAVS